LASSSPIWAGEQAPRPLAELGFTDIPAGKVISARFRCAVARPSGLSGWGIVSLTLRPLGESAAELVGFAVRAASKGTF
jgi:hypothetical protein